MIKILHKNLTKILSVKKNEKIKIKILVDCIVLQNTNKIVQNREEHASVVIWKFSNLVFTVVMRVVAEWTLSVSRIELLLFSPFFLGFSLRVANCHPVQNSVWYITWKKKEKNRWVEYNYVRIKINDRNKQKNVSQGKEGNARN